MQTALVNEGSAHDKVNHDCRIWVDRDVVVSVIPEVITNK